MLVKKTGADSQDKFSPPANVLTHFKTRPKHHNIGQMQHNKLNGAFVGRVVAAKGLGIIGDVPRMGPWHCQERQE
jgi:hypothetical protein